MTFFRGRDGTGQTGQTDKQTNRQTDIRTDRLFSENIILDRAYFLQSPLESLACCIVSKLIATLITYPCQNLRARKQAGDLAIAANSPTTLTNILQKEGFCGLYRGLVPTLIHVTPNVCIVFLAYEFFVGRKMF